MNIFLKHHLSVKIRKSSFQLKISLEIVYISVSEIFSVLRVHRSFRGRSGFHPSSQPNLPELDVIENPTLQRYV